MKAMNTQNQFPTTYYEDLHKDYHVNFQLNRFLAYVGEDELPKFREVGKKVSNFEEWKQSFINLAEESQEKGDKIRAGYYYRAAEFFMWRDDSNKKPTRDKFLKLVREGYNINKEYHLVPHEEDRMKGYLPAYYFDHPNPKDTIVIMGGGDSYVEEWLPFFLSIKNQGYRMVIFEAPGQGGALEEYNLPMTHNYHKAAKSILDYFNLDEVCFWGISGGGMAALRVAAFEKRVQRVVCHDVLYGVFDLMLRKMKPGKRFMLRLLMKLNGGWIINKKVEATMKKDLSVKGLIGQGMLIHGVETPFEYLKKIRKEKTGDISHLVDQDVLLLAGQEDFGVPVDHFYKQIEALQNVRSLTARLFTRKEQAQDHCQVGNIGLALDIITNWIDITRETQENRDIRKNKNATPWKSGCENLVNPIHKN